MVSRFQNLPALPRGPKAGRCSRCSRKGMAVPARRRRRHAPQAGMYIYRRQAESAGRQVGKRYPLKQSRWREQVS